MIYNLTEVNGPYKNFNLLNVDITSDDDVLLLEGHFGSHYDEFFGSNLVEKMGDKSLVSIQLVMDNDEISNLNMDGDEEFLDKNSPEFDKDSKFVPILKGTPKKYKYRLGGFYVNVKRMSMTQPESDFFKGIGHALLCWVFEQLKLKASEILALEASGDGNQKLLVEFYKKLGFKTCGDVSKMTNAWWGSASGSSVCMYSTIGNFKKICSKKERKFVGKIDEPFKRFKNL